MISRNEEKMKTKIEEIEKKINRSDIKFTYIVADFGKMSTINDY
jgi:hypothetical protein